MGDGRSTLGFDERERATEMRGIRENNRRKWEFNHNFPTI